MNSRFRQSFNENRLTTVYHVELDTSEFPSDIAQRMVMAMTNIARIIHARAQAMAQEERRQHEAAQQQQYQGVNFEDLLGMANQSRTGSDDLFDLLRQRMRSSQQQQARTAPPPPRSTPQTEAWNLLKVEADVAGVELTKENLRLVYLAAAKRCHPDAGGTNARFQAVNAANTLLAGWI